MIRSKPYRRNKNIKLAAVDVDVIPESPGTSEGVLDEGTLTKANSLSTLNNLEDLQNKEGGAEQEQVDETAGTLMSNYVNAFFDKTTETQADYKTSVSSINASMKYIEINLEVDASQC